MKRILFATALLVLPCALADPAQTPAPPPPAGETKGPLPAVTRPAPVYDDEYVIGSHDVIAITVFDLKDLDSKRRVSGDGKISLPLLGEVEVGGLTPQQTEEAIAELLRDRNLVKNPQVSVSIEEYRSRMVNVQGAVEKPGTYPMLGQMSLLDAIGEAGGLNDRAGRTIFILRPMASGTEDRIEIDTEKLVFDGNILLNVALLPGDIVMVPYRQECRVYVNGAVRTPSLIKFPCEDGMSVLQAITSAGGATERANERRVNVIRRLPNGAKQVMKVNLKRVQSGKAEDLMLQENDIVQVHESFF
ncbi:MAG: SLBB domain-containing protein [Acidobacteria bacterium]|nr:SLBB domain-containing protein [Acidobacteriota bacterium]